MKQASKLLGTVAVLALAGSSLQAQVGFGAGTTGGAGGTTVTVSNESAFKTYAGNASTKYIVRVSGTISLGAMTTIGSNKSILGVGSSAKITKYGIRADGKTNIVVRNINFTGSGDDGMEITNGSSKIWVDHCSFSSNYDGCLDTKRGSTNVSISNNLFSNHNKVSLIGHNDNNASQDSGKLKVTVYNNYYNGTTQRHPLCRYGTQHVYNNYYRSLGSYGIATLTQAQVRVQNNSFSSVARPISYSEGGVSGGSAAGSGNVLSGSGALTWKGSVFTPSYSFSMISGSAVATTIPANAGVGKVTF